MYEILKRVKKGSFDSEVITSIMENQTDTATLSVVSEGEKFRIQDLYPRVSLSTGQGSMRFDIFRRLLRDCFDPVQPVLDNVHTFTHHHAMVAFEKQPN